MAFDDLRSFMSARAVDGERGLDGASVPPLRGALRSGYKPRKNTLGFPPLLRRDF